VKERERERERENMRRNFEETDCMNRGAQEPSMGIPEL
jgi:hypothetical protein